jgi:hypothetical protein
LTLIRRKQLDAPVRFTEGETKGFIVRKSPFYPMGQRPSARSVGLVTLTLGERNRNRLATDRTERKELSPMIRVGPPRSGRRTDAFPIHANVGLRPLPLQFFEIGDRIGESVGVAAPRHFMEP